MTFGPKDLAKLLNRTDLSIPFEDFVKDVCQTYDLGTIYSLAPILEGYEDANIRISSEKGEFVLKIFAKEKTLPQIKSYVSVLDETKKKDLPFIRLTIGNQGYLSSYTKENSSVYYILTVFFNGKNFESYTPFMSEIEDVTRILAQFNTINIPVVESYDSWGNKNLVREYSDNENSIPSEIKQLVPPIVNEMRMLDTSTFSTSVIHGDLQRKHILKNDKGEYCILDLGCLRYDARVYDLSVHLAWFCLAEDTWSEKEKIVETVIREYTSVNELTQEELSSLPLLTKAAYAAYLLKTSLLIQAGDTSDETHDWYRQAKTMLQLMNEWDWNV